MSTAEHLDRSMAHAVAWNAAAKWTTQIVTWACTILVARLLTPYDFGLVGMAGVYLCLATLISQTGIGDAVIALRKLTHRQLAELNTVALLVAATLVGVSCLLSHPIAKFFAAPELAAVVMVASMSYLVTGFQIVPRALLQKELRFKLLSVIEMIRALFQIMVTVILALFQFGYWSLILGTMAGSLAGTILILCWKRHEFALPKFAALREELKFSGHVLLGGISWYVYDNADFGVAGRVLGGAPLGNYTVAWTIASAPVERIANLVTNVTPAFFSSVQSNSAELRRYFLHLTEILALVTLPASVGLALTADYLVPVILGPKWDAAIGPLRLLGIFIAVRSVAAILPNLLTAIRDARFVMLSTFASAVIMPIAFLIGSHWGTDGIAAAWVIAYPPIMMPLYWRVFQKTGTRMKDYASAVTPALTSSLVMAAVVMIARVESVFRPQSLPGLCFLVITGILSYTCALFIFHYHRVLRVAHAIKRVLEAKASAEQPVAVGS